MKASCVVLAAAFPLLAVPSFATAGVRIGIGISVGRPSYGGGYGYGRRSVETFRYGYDRGHQEGARDGYHDGERGRRFELYHEDDYRDADQGYKRWMGPRYEYENGYRSGYEEGYRQAFRQGRDRGDHGRRYRDYDNDDMPRRRW